MVALISVASATLKPLSTASAPNRMAKGADATTTGMLSRAPRQKAPVWGCETASTDMGPFLATALCMERGHFCHMKMVEPTISETETGSSLRHPFEPGILVDDFDAKFGRLLQLGARARPGHHQIGLLGDGSRHL